MLLLTPKGAAGPSGLDAHCWRRLCTSFHSASRDLCHSLALFARRLCTSFVDPKALSPFLACRLIALDKCPGVRPIGICEAARRIVSKAILFIFRDDIQDAAGSIQLCAGQIAGVEAAIHFMRETYSAEDCEAVILVDASNAFNSLNRECALLNIRFVCPPLATVLINTYRNATELFVGGNTLFSAEGTTQGDPLAMPMYAMATIPLADSSQLFLKGAKQVRGMLTTFCCKWDLHKRALHISLACKIGWPLRDIPSHCSTCGAPFSVDMNFLASSRRLHHSETRDQGELTAKFSSEVCHDVCIEPACNP